MGMADTEPARTRAGWMDMLRGLAVLLVALFHIQYPVGERVPGTPDELMRFGEAMQPFRMPLLFFLSGLLLPRSLAKPMKEYTAGKLRGLVWPFALWTAIVVVCFEVLWTDDDPLWLFKDVPAMLMGWQHMWFLSVLIVCYAVAPLTRFLPSWALPIPMAVASTLIVPDGSWAEYGQKVLWYGAFFFVGAAVSSYLHTWQGLHPALPAAMLAFTVVWGYVAAHDGELRTAMGFSTFLISLVGVLGVLWLAPRVPRIRFLEWAGRGSIVVYLVNLTAITVAFESIDALGITDAWAVVTILCIAGLALPLAMVPLSRTVLFTWPARHAPAPPRTGGTVTPRRTPW